MRFGIEAEMDPKHLEKCQQRVFSQAPILGNWRRGRAIRALMKDGSADAIRLVAEVVVHSPDEPTRVRAVEALRRLTQAPAIDVVCSVWVGTRSPRLGRLVFEWGWIASSPPQAKVLTALGTRRLEIITAGEAALIDPLVEACWDVDPELAPRARTCLLNLKSPAAVDALCARWARTREEILLQAIEQANYVAIHPIAVRVLVALRRSQLDAVVEGGPEVVEPLIHACADLDPGIAQRAQRALGGLTRAETQEALCRQIIESDLPGVREIAVAAPYAPREPGERALYYFLTEQWEKCDGLDFDQHLLGAAYERGSRTLRCRIAEKARRAGRTEWIEVIVGGQQNRHISEMADEEWEAVLAALGESRRWPEMWRLAQAAPADWSARLLRGIKTADWKPEAAHERAGFAKLLEWADQCREEPPFLGRLMRCASPLQGHTAAVSCLAVTRDGRHVVSAGNDDTVRLWNLEEGGGGAIFQGHTDWVSCLALSPDERILASASRDGSARLWSLPDGAPIVTLSGHQDAIRGLAFTPDGRSVVTASDDATLRIWRIGEVEAAQILRGHSDIISCLAVSHDGRWVASGSYDNHVRLWSLADGACVATCQGHKAMVNCLAFSPDGATLVTGGKDRTLLVWSLPSGSRLARMKGHNDDVSCLAISPDGCILASGSWDTTVRLWSYPTGAALDTLGARDTMEGHAGWVTCLAFSPDGRVLATGGLDNRVRLWSVPGGAPLRVLEQHQDRISSVGFSLDGRMLVSGSWDRTICIWKSELARLRRLPLGQTTVADLDWAQQALFNSRLSDAERAWLEFLQAMIQWRRRFDVQLGDAERIPVGEFDIEIDG